MASVNALENSHNMPSCLRKTIVQGEGLQDAELRTTTNSRLVYVFSRPASPFSCGPWQAGEAKGCADSGSGWEATAEVYA